jgi:DNA-binding protein HU-beta/integration host factor subunit alpha
VNNKQFIAELAHRMGYTAQDTQRMVNHLTDAMGDSFQEGNTVAILNFGSFEVKKKMERIIVNPTTGQRMLVPPKLALGFKISSTWKEQLKNGGAD